MQKKLFAVMSLLIIAAFVLVACAPAATPAPEEPVAEEPAAPSIKACQVTDTGGIDDKSFNATAWKGVEDAMAEFNVEGKYLESQQQTDYAKNLNAFIEEGCDLIIPVGFLLADDTAAFAEANPDVLFSIVDVGWLEAPNIQGQAFQTDEAAFLAGYLAAGVSETGKLGAFGGIQIPTVTIFMDGFALGAAHYNSVHGTSVEVLGWDIETQTGLFTNNFESLEDGRLMAEQLMDEGVDIIMPVAGPVGLGTAAAAQERGGVYIVGVDNDWAVVNEAYADITLTSVMKFMDVTTFDAIKSVVDGTFEAGLIMGTLENGGVGLADYHELAGMVSADLQAEINDLTSQISAGEIATSP
ncbi:MAG: BMP family ABC transporter substrate-binding protein [Anaerolineales bacterium]